MGWADRSVPTVGASVESRTHGLQSPLMTGGNDPAGLTGGFTAAPSSRRLRCSHRPLLVTLAATTPISRTGPGAAGSVTAAQNRTGAKAFGGVLSPWWNRPGAGRVYQASLTRDCFPSRGLGPSLPPIP
jgi:hypothetical protein